MEESDSDPEDEGSGSSTPPAPELFFNPMHENWSGAGKILASRFPKKMIPADGSYEPMVVKAGPQKRPTTPSSLLVSASGRVNEQIAVYRERSEARSRSPSPSRWVAAPTRPNLRDTCAPAPGRYNVVCFFPSFTGLSCHSLVSALLSYPTPYTTREAQVHMSQDTLTKKLDKMDIFCTTSPEFQGARLRSPAPSRVANGLFRGSCG